MPLHRPGETGALKIRRKYELMVQTLLQTGIWTVNETGSLCKINKFIILIVNSSTIGVEHQILTALDTGVDSLNFQGYSSIL